MSAFLRPRVENIFPTRGNLFFCFNRIQKYRIQFYYEHFIVTEVTVTVLYRDRLVYQISDISFVLKG